MMRGLIAGACGAAIAVAASITPYRADATVIAGPATYRERATCGGTGTILGADIFAPETVANNGIGCYAEAATGSAGAAAGDPGFPGLGAPWARSILETNESTGGTVSASASYEFGVGVLPGGDAGVMVPVFINAFLLVEFSGTGVGISDLTANINVAGLNFTRTACVTDPITFEKTCTEWAVELSLPIDMFADGPTDFVTLQTFAQGSAPSMRAIVDPLIVIDPNFPDRDRYEIVLSPGIEVPQPPPPPGVPEPGSLTLFGFGLAGLAVMWRRRKH